ncbi:hypothetical protein Golax_001032 [Gossypium laxum]|uniref:Uncharacterized protein n=1 Tax=Gossypium laxum TaxID=34288 RepID=A0A7J9AVS4_9ROSI|nr:hypothetical protein [Gossypium laxum]
MPPPNSHSDFQEKMLYLESIGLDFFSLIQHHPPIIFASLHDLKSTIDFLASLSFTTLELCRILSMCPHILTVKPTSLLPIFTFLLREAHVNGSDLKKVINRRPRLLACNVETQLRPTLYFLQSIGISETSEVEFCSRLEVCCNSTLPLKGSPLWRTKVSAMDGTVGILSPENLSAVLKSQIMKCRDSMVEPSPSHLKAPKVDKSEDEWHE